MKILITGATGFIGKKLVHKLISLGHSPVILSRSKDKAQSIFDENVVAHEWKDTSILPPKEAFEDIDAIINLMGENIGNKRWGKKQKEKIYNSRVIGTRSLISAANKYINKKIELYIGTSAIGYFQPTSEINLTEESSPSDSFLAKTCRDWEEESSKASFANRNITMRLGAVIGDEGGMVHELKPLFNKNLGGVVGNGKQYMSWIHVEDIIHFIEKAISNQNYNHTYNVVTPTPITNRHFTKVFAKSLGKIAPFPAPSFIVKLALGEMSILPLDSIHVIPQRLLQQKHEYIYPTIEDALLK